MEFQETPFDRVVLLRRGDYSTSMISMIGSMRYGPRIQHVALASWSECGPGTDTNINVKAEDWVRTVRQIAANPFSVKTGLSLKIKLAYLGSLVKAYDDTELLKALARTRHAPPRAGETKEIMNEYKSKSRHHCNGEISLALERERLRRKDYE